MREVKPGIIYELANIDGSYSQKIVFASKDAPGTTPEEVLNVLIEKLYQQQAEIFICEISTGIEMLKSCRRILAKTKERRHRQE